MKKKNKILLSLLITGGFLFLSYLNIVLFSREESKQTMTPNQLLTQTATPEAIPVIKEEDTLDGIKRLTVRAKDIKDSFVIDILVPENYDRAKKYPVLYLTDGNYRREIYKDIQSLSKKGSISDLIIISICYPVGYDIDMVRTRDLVFHARDFLKFIVNDIVPYINANYSVDQTNQTLYGCSLGGYFAVYSLLQHEGLTKGVFHNYIIASPSLKNKSDGYSPYEYEEELHKFTQELALNVYVTVGSMEYADVFQGPIEEFSNQLLSHDYRELNYHTKVYDGLDHGTAWMPTLYDGLKMFVATGA